MGTPFQHATTVEVVREGCYRATIDPSWELRPVPQGGLVTALAVRALEAELDDPTQQLRTLHTAFASQVSSGAVEIEAEVLRRGRSMSQVRGEVHDPGAPRGHLTTAVFGRSRRGFSFTDLRPPTGVPGPDDCPSFREPPPAGVVRFEPMRFWTERVEGRSVVGTPPWEDGAGERAERVQWYRFDEPPVDDDGRLDPLGVIVLADVMPGAVGEKVGGTGDPWFAPSVDLTLHLLGEWRSPWLLGHNTARFAGDGYASTDMALWDLGPDLDEEPRLIAYATQICLFSFA